MSGLLISVVSVLYLGFLFYLAFFVEKLKTKNINLINNPVVYSLSLAIYCTTWTFYGSVGRVTKTGIEFLSVYLGPTLVMLLGWSLLRKLIRIAHVHKLTSIADFISVRYGKYRYLGICVSIISFFAGVPYIGLQIKAISSSFQILSGTNSGLYFYQDYAFLIAVLLIFFTILFGTRNIKPDETHEGMVLAIAFESILKLFAFILVGFFVTYYLNNGFNSVFENHFKKEEIKKAFDFENQTGYGNWLMHILIAAFSFLFLPRQFQVAVVENQNENNLKHAIWLLPLYLFLINVFVIPIALTGNSILGSDISINADNYVIALPMYFKSNFIALIVFIGGFSAASGMIIMETIAISTMLTNSIILPTLLENRRFKEKFKFKILNLAIFLRRFSIVFIVMCGFVFYKTIASQNSLVSLGMIAFVAISQFAPIVIAGIFWKDGTRKGALVGLLAGILIWFFGLLLPHFLLNSNNNYPYIFLEKMYNLFGYFKISVFDNISNIAFWSLMINTFLYFTVSLFTKQTPIEEKQAILFVDVFKYSTDEGQSVFWNGNTKIDNLIELLSSFVGVETAKATIKEFSLKNQINLNYPSADPRMVAYIETMVGGIIGSSSARILVSSITNEEVVSVDEVLEVLKGSQRILEDNQELINKTKDLEILSKKLKNANEALKKSDSLKNEFLSTVTHEIRTPLTSIKALSEIIYDNEDLDIEQKKEFLNIIIIETDRLSRLVNQVLELEKYETGVLDIKKDNIEVKNLINTAIHRINELAADKNIKLITKISEDVPNFIGDFDMLIQMFINLLSNAIKFGKPNEGWVLIKVEFINKKMLISVEDNGIGIQVEMQKRIFEKFFQANNQESNKQIGSGLGLSITKKIVEIHAGTIQFESQPFIGTKIVISFPY
jgi:Na+/proline symporter/signal transduction histidine kinase